MNLSNQDNAPFWLIIFILMVFGSCLIFIVQILVWLKTGTWVEGDIYSLSTAIGYINVFDTESFIAKRSELRFNFLSSISWNGVREIIDFFGQLHIFFLAFIWLMGFIYIDEVMGKAKSNSKKGEQSK